MKENIPPGLSKLRTQFKSKLKASKVSFERIPGLKRYRIGIVSPGFKGVSHLKRQDRIWKVVDENLTPAESMRISLILAFAPDELSIAKPKQRGSKKTISKAARA
jgi:stress-induced morphogen